MKKHVLIEWRDPFESGDVRESFGRAASLARSGDSVTLILVREGVEAAVRGEYAFWFAELGRLGVEVIADQASLRAREIAVGRISRWVRAAAVTLPLDALIGGEALHQEPALRAAS